MPTESSAPTVPEVAASAPAELQLLSDVIPSLRSDLTIDPRPGEAGLFNVGLVNDPGRVFTLYDFEVSIARMLDGKRTASQLIDAAGKIGIPVTLDSLRKFIRQLRAYRFLEDAPEAADGTGGWAPRAEWPPEIRELFQSALRTFRNDRPTEARGYLEALLQIKPELPEAIELMKRIEERILSGATPLPSFDAIHGEELPGAAATEPPDLFAEDALENTDRYGALAPPRVSDEAFEDETEVLARPRRRFPMVAIGVAVLGLGGVMAIPVPTRVSASAELAAAGAPIRLLSPRSGKIAELFAKPGSWVKSGEQLIRLDSTELDQREQSLKDALSGIDGRIEHLQSRADSRAVRKTRSALEKKQAQVEKLTAQRDALAKREDGRSRRRLKGVERSLARKQHDLEKLQESYARRSGEAELKALADEKTAKQAELAGVEQERTHSVLVASGTGTFEPTRRVGDPVLTGEAVGTVVDARKLKVILGVPERQATRVKEGQPVSIRVNGSPAEIRTVVLTTSGESAGAGLVRATAEIPNADNKLAIGANGLAEIDCGSDALFRRLLGSH